MTKGSQPIFTISTVASLFRIPPVGTGGDHTPAVCLKIEFFDSECFCLKVMFTGKDRFHKRPTFCLAFKIIFYEFSHSHLNQIYEVLHLLYVWKF